MTEWRNGMPWSPVNAFTMAPPVNHELRKKKPGPKKQPKSIRLKGSRPGLFEPDPSSYFEITKSDPNRTARIRKASI